jgi:hypothetical protein
MSQAPGSTPVAWPATATATATAVLATAITATTATMARWKEHPAAAQAQGHKKGNQQSDSTKHR